MRLVVYHIVGYRTIQYRYGTVPVPFVNGVVIRTINGTVSEPEWYGTERDITVPNRALLPLNIQISTPFSPISYHEAL